MSKPIHSRKPPIITIQGIINIGEFESAIEATFGENEEAKEKEKEKEKEKLLKLLGSRGTSRRQLSWFCKPLSDLVAASNLISSLY